MTTYAPSVRWSVLVACDGHGKRSNRRGGETEAVPPSLEHATAQTCLTAAIVVAPWRHEVDPIPCAPCHLGMMQVVFEPRYFLCLFDEALT